MVRFLKIGVENCENTEFHVYTKETVTNQEECGVTFFQKKKPRLAVVIEEFI